MISLQSVTAKAGSFRLSDITFDVPQGSYAVVIGPAGSGKTTLLETIAGVSRRHPAASRSAARTSRARRLNGVGSVSSISTRSCFRI